MVKKGIREEGLRSNMDSCCEMGKASMKINVESIFGETRLMWSFVKRIKAF